MCKHGIKQSRIHKLRTRAAYQYAAGSQNLHRAQIYFFIAAVGFIERLCIFCKSGRIQNNHIEQAVFLFVFFENVEYVGLNNVHTAFGLIQGNVFFYRFNGVFGYVDGGYAFCTAMNGV